MNELEQLENRLSQIRAPQMPSDMEARIRERLATQTAMPPKIGPFGSLAGLLGPSPAFAAQAAVLAALLALAAALFAHDADTASVSVTSTPPAAVHSTAAPGSNYAVTFMVPTINSGQPAQPSGPPMIAPPPPPRKHR